MTKPLTFSLVIFSQDQFINAYLIRPIQCKHFCAHMHNAFFDLFSKCTNRNDTSTFHVRYHKALDLGLNARLRMVKKSDRFFGFSASFSNNNDRTLVCRWAESIRI